MLVTPKSALQRDHHVFELPMHDVPVRLDCHQQMPCSIDNQTAYVKHNQLVETFCWLFTVFVHQE